LIYADLRKNIERLVEGSRMLSRNRRRARQRYCETGENFFVDGFKIVIDLERSRGSLLVDAANGRQLVDLYSFTPPRRSVTIIRIWTGRKWRPSCRRCEDQGGRTRTCIPLLRAVRELFARVMPLKPLERFLFHRGRRGGGGNALKAAMDWKVRKNMAAGRGERGTEILHFERRSNERAVNEARPGTWRK